MEIGEGSEQRNSVATSQEIDRQRTADRKLQAEADTRIEQTRAAAEADSRIEQNRAAAEAQRGDTERGREVDIYV